MSVNVKDKKGEQLMGSEIEEGGGRWKKGGEGEGEFSDIWQLEGDKMIV